MYNIRYYFFIVFLLNSFYFLKIFFVGFPGGAFFSFKLIFKNFYFLIGGKLLYYLCWFLPYNSVISHNLYIYIYIYIPSLLNPSPPAIPLHRSSRNTELSSLCRIAASHWLSFSHMVVYICQCHFLSSPNFTFLCHVPKSILR